MSLWRAVGCRWAKYRAVLATTSGDGRLIVTTASVSARLNGWSKGSDMNVVVADAS
jgi:hypothetical protein